LAIDHHPEVPAPGLPIDQQDLKIQHLHTETRVAVLPADHRLAGKTTISITDLADEHLLQNPNAVPEWRDIATELRARTPRGEPVFHSVEEKLEHVAAGHGITILPGSVTTFYSRADVVHVTIHDIAPNQICLAWDSTRRDGVIHEFADIAAEHSTAIMSPPTSGP
jgi:DNA-binding transcriptional LysR family regulator